MIKLVVRPAACLALATALLSVCAAQQTTPPPTAEPSKTQPQDTSKDPTKNQQQLPDPGISGPGKVQGTSNDRLFYALPNFLSLENSGKVPPMTTKQKFAAVARSNFDPALYPWYGFLSGISQAENSEPGFGQGAAGYGKRYASAFADGSIENFLTSAAFPSMLHQDPRFFQLGKGSFIHRAGYAATRIIVTRSDAGNRQFNYSEIIGGALSATVSTYSYHPKGKFVSTPTNPHYYIASDRTLPNTAKVWWTQMGYDAMTYTIKEFWPDIHRKLSHKSKVQPVPVTQ